jgi:GntR family transcriptional regulator/GntR family frlABCD operon transcriptional regulator
MAKIGYMKVQNDLRKQIVVGEYSVGDLLPSENKLSAQYGLSRMTVRHALKNLENEGLIYRKKGKGSFVGTKHSSLELLSVKGLTEIMKGKVDVNTIFLQEPKVKDWPDDFYWALEPQELAHKCIHLSRIRMIEQKPMMHEDAFVVNKNLEGFCSQPFVNDSLFDTLLINHDVEITTVAQKIGAISASKEFAARLQIQEGDPILEIIRKLSTNRPGLFVYSIIYCNTNDYMIEA